MEAVRACNWNGGHYFSVEEFPVNLTGFIYTSHFDKYKIIKAEIILFIVVALFGTLLESFAMSSGAWSYTDQQILNFPIWLPLYWGMGGVVMKDTYQIIQKLSK